MLQIKIIGNLTPEVGVTETYSVIQHQDLVLPHSDTVQNTEANIFDKEIEWFIYVLDAGIWRLAGGNKKRGKTVTYRFSETSPNWKGMKMIVHAYGQKDMVDIKPKKASQAKITFIELLDANYNKPTRPFAYNDWIIARIHCVDMEVMPVQVTLWEDDGDKAKQNSTNVKLETKKGDVIGGKADVSFFLNPSHAWLANAKLAPADANEGEFHEYYVTAEIFEKKSKRVATLNTNVANPDYKPPTSKLPIPAEQKGPSKKDKKGIAKPEKKVHDYHEEKVSVKNEIWKDPFVEKINSLMMVNIGGVWGSKKDNCVCKENNFYWSNKLTCDERKKVLEVCANIWGEDKKKDKASELMSVIHLETGSQTPFKPYADNGKGFSGLIQFSDAAAKQLGTTRANLKKMTFIDQMVYVENYLIKKKLQLNTMTDLYLMVLKPNAVGKGNDPDFILFDESISVPDGDGRNTSKDQRMININQEPWVTKYGYASNPPFMKGKEHTQRKKWVYTRQQYEQRWGVENGNTTVGEVAQELKENHYDKGASHLFKGNCDDTVEEKKEIIGGKAPWMEFAIQEFETYKGLREIDSPLKEKIPIYFEISSAKGLKFDDTDPWCGAFVVWCFEQTKDFKKINKLNSARAFGWLAKNWDKGEDSEPFVGATIIFDYSHVAFIVGENKDGTKYVYLGGNQGNGIKTSGYQKIIMGAVLKKDKSIKGITKPKNYIISDDDKKLPKYDVNAENTKESSR